MSLDDVIEAVLAGFAEGSADTALTVSTLVTAMRTDTDSLGVAEAAIRFRDRGVVGFDIAGRESGYPPTLHLKAFQYLQRENFHVTIHAGEAFGVASIWEAVQFCGAERLGHGVRIVDDITFDDDGSTRLGRLAAFVRDRRLPLELCPTSNVHTGAVATIAEHPIGLLRDLGFRVTVNTDNRLMSGVSMTSELSDLQTAFGWGLDDFRWLTINAMKSAFLPFDQRLELINGVIKPGYAGFSG
jgi:adenosine deaminase